MSGSKGYYPATAYNREKGSYCIMRNKEFKELTFADSFMFAKVLQRNKKLCKRYIEICTKKKIKEIYYPDADKRLEPAYDQGCIRYGFYVTDDEGSYYVLDMQFSDKQKDIPSLLNYYHRFILTSYVEPNEDFSNIPDVYVIFLGLEDIIKGDEPVYNVSTTVVGLNSTSTYEIDDGEYTIILNAACSSLSNNDMGNLLGFVKTGIPTDDFTKDLLHEVELVKQDKELEAEYMRDIEDLDNMSAEREAKMLVNDVKNLMKNLEIPITLEKACKILEHTVEEYNEALEFLKAEER